MLKQEIVIIGEHEFEISQLPHTPSKKVLFRFLKTVGPAIAEALDAAPTLEGLKRGMDLSGLGQGLRTLLDRLKLEDLDYFAEQFGKYSRVIEDGSRPRLDAKKRETFFAGEMFLYMKWIKACFEVNYSDFLAEWANAQDEERQSEKETTD